MNLNGRLSYEGNVSGSLGAELVADVEANPSGPASQTLVKIRVGDVIYSIPTGGGGGGTSDYNLLNNKPKVNNITIEGELTLSDLGIQPAISFPGDPTKYMDGTGEFSTPDSGVVDYSTSEVNTGVKWDDSKDIYRQTIIFTNEIIISNNNWTPITFPNPINYYDNFIRANAYNSLGVNWGYIPIGKVNNNISLSCNRNGDTIGVKKIVIEYTKN